MESNRLAPDVKIVLDANCVVRQVTTANDLSDEEVSLWIGRPWADTVEEIGAAALSELLLATREESISPIFKVIQKFPGGLVVPFEYMVFCRDNGREFVAVGRDVRSRVAKLPSRLPATRKSMERDYRKLRGLESGNRSRYETADALVQLIEFLDGMAGRLGRASLKEAVSSAVGLVERYYIEAVLKEVDGNRTAAARILGISRQGLYDKLARYGIHEHPDKPKRPAKVEVFD